MEYKKNLKYIAPTIVIFSISIFYFLLMLVLNCIENEVSLISKSISDSTFIFFFISVLTFPGFILHFRYELLNRNKTITFKKKHLEITTETEVKSVLYSNILEIENHSVAWKWRNTWSHYYYVKLNLMNGEKEYYNCLTKKVNSESVLFKDDRIKKFESEDVYPWY